jgi:hypothetical protein
VVKSRVTGTSIIYLHPLALLFDGSGDEAADAIRARKPLHPRDVHCYNFVSGLETRRCVRSACLVAMFATLAVPGVAAAEDIGWQEAVARLRFERNQAETCAALLKRHGEPAAIDRGAVSYKDAKDEYDAIIAGLDVALASRDQPSSLPDLEVRLRRGYDKRVAFCDSVRPLLPPTLAGQKGPMADIVSGAVGPLVDALKAIWLRTRDDNALMRKTIETQLEATAWPSFASVSASF